jgi:hypothetical protein
MWKEKMSLTGFFAYALEKAPITFAVMLMRELVWLIIAGTGIAIYVFFLQGIDFMDILTATYVLFVTFFIHLLFTPPLVYTSLGMDLVGSFKRSFNFFKRRHINFIGLYFVFAFAWLLNFIPFIGLFSIFFLYPVAYTAIIAMMEGGVKIDRDDEES